MTITLAEACFAIDRARVEAGADLAEPLDLALAEDNLTVVVYYRLAGHEWSGSAFDLPAPPPPGVLFDPMPYAAQAEAFLAAPGRA